MNNTATIRTLAAMVVAVVLIFTSGTLAAATSSFTPQPQNLICTQPGDNATCSQERIMSTTTAQIPLSTSQQPQPRASAALAIIKHVIDDIVGTM